MILFLATHSWLPFLALPVAIITAVTIIDVSERARRRRRQPSRHLIEHRARHAPDPYCDRRWQEP
jgi:hypothetical protein